MDRFGQTESTSNALASATARQQTRQVSWSLGGLVVLVVSYMVALGLQRWGVATEQFARTVLWCTCPYAVTAHWLYRSAVLPAAEQLGVLWVTTATPFILTPLGFALLQQPYSRGAVLLVYALSVTWFSVGNWLHWRKNVQRLAYLDPGIPEQLDTFLGVGAKAMQSVQLVPWFHPQLEGRQALASDGVVLDTSLPMTDERTRLLGQLKLRHVRLYSVQAVAELLSGRRVLPTHQNELWQLDGNPAYDSVKRAFDVIAVLVALPLWLPVCVATGIWVKLDSQGPVLYTQKRVGRDGRSFPIWKFRSMQHQELVQSASFTTSQDTRITRAGRVIRRWRLDELPQLWNVLRGDMSLIGPRPEQTELVEEFATRIPAYPYRHLVRPGITGWAQVQQGYAEGEQATAIKLSYDLYYVANYSVALDLLITFKTARIVLSGFGAR